MILFISVKESILSFLVVILLLCFLSPMTFCDIYMHNLRGSNNRATEKGRERTNAKRLFDSQNNNRGGYNIGEPMKFYEGSVVQIEWTHQHSCADKNAECTIVLQYMCDPCLRDGNNTDTIPLNVDSSCADGIPAGNTQYGLHEKLESYLDCVTRPANPNLFFVNKKPVNPSATITRQNPQGTRYGFECPEERDYYPYWRPTGWRDIAVLTDTAEYKTRCSFYQNASENISPRSYCAYPLSTLLKAANEKKLLNDTSESACKSGDGQWMQVASHSLPPPLCQAPQSTRDNHLGNTNHGMTSTFEWTLPKVSSPQQCVLRIRYNISTGDYPSWMGMDAQRANTVNLEIAKAAGAPLPESGESRGYKFTNNPEVLIFEDLPNLKLQLAVNVAQFGRTFQDRSHVFQILPRTSHPQLSSSGRAVHNVNVRGKRGNIVQTFPAVEYDFVPDTLVARSGDFLHFQWTGSDTNNADNAGQGTAGTDRSNIVLMAPPAYDKRQVGNSSVPPLAYRLLVDTVLGQWSRAYPASNMSTDEMGLPVESANWHRLALAGGEPASTGPLLNEAQAYFDSGPVAVRPGTSAVYHYMSTRNNDFSNRSHKGRLIVSEVMSEQLSVGPSGGTATTADKIFSMSVVEGAVPPGRNIVLDVLSIPATREDKALEYFGIQPPPGSFSASDYMFLRFSENLTSSLQVELEIRLNAQSQGCPSHLAVYSVFSTGTGQASSTAGSWRIRHLLPSCNRGLVTFVLNEAGDQSTLLVLRVHNVVAGLVLGILAVFLILFLVLAGVVCYFRRHPAVWNRYRLLVRRPTHDSAMATYKM